jgi:predicted FMN-binding regulatory protein PaiB
MDYTITLTEAEAKAMQYVAVDPQDWIDNAVHNRARIAIDEICDLYVKHKLENNQPITATNKPDMVLAAYEEGLVKTAAQRNEEVANNTPSL